MMSELKENKVTTKLYHYKGMVNELKNIQVIDKQIYKVRTFLSNQLQNRNLNIFIEWGCSIPAINLMGVTIQNIINEENNNFIKIKIKDYIELKNKELSNKLNLESFSDIEGFLTWLNKGIDFENNENAKKEYKETYNSLKKQFIQTIPKFNDEKYNNNNHCNTINYYMDFYSYIFAKRKKDFPKLNVFTTNYDLFNEYAFENLKINYTTGFDTGLNQYFNINQFNYRLVDSRERYKDRWQPTSKEANLYKLHGSINWVQNKDDKLVQNNKSNNSVENVIIYPTVLKHQETMLSPYSELFRELSIQLQKPNSTLIVIGYGFGDDHINNIISQNLTNEDFTLIILGDIEESMLKKFRGNKPPNNLHIIGGIISTESKAHHFSRIVEFLCYNKY